MKSCLFLALLLSAPPSEPRLTIHTTPRTPTVGSSVRIACKVPHDSRNRWLTIGLEDGSSSVVQLDGEEAPLIIARTYRVDSCGDLETYCGLAATDGDRLVRETITVSGCF